MNGSLMPVCDLCGSKMIKSLYEFEMSKVVRCQACNLLFTYPRTTEEEMERIFSSRELCDRLFPELKNYDECFTKEGNTVVCTYLDALEEIGAWGRRGKILDVGCGRGDFLKLAAQKGWESYGLDFSRPSADYAKKNFGIDVLAAKFEEAKFDDNFFDAVTMWDYLEHTKSPAEVLKKLNAITKKGSIVVIASPNMDSLLEKIAGFCYRISFKKIKSPLAKQYPFSHSYHFTVSTLSKYLEKSGFKIIKIKKENTHLERLNLNALTKAVLSVIFKVSNLLGKQNRLIVFAQKI